MRLRGAIESFRAAEEKLDAERLETLRRSTRLQNWLLRRRIDRQRRHRRPGGDDVQPGNQQPHRSRDGKYPAHCQRRDAAAARSRLR